jgi:hypothetical protein
MNDSTNTSEVNILNLERLRKIENKDNILLLFKKLDSNL